MNQPAPGFRCLACGEMRPGFSRRPIQGSDIVGGKHPLDPIGVRRPGICFGCGYEVTAKVVGMNVIDADEPRPLAAQLYDLPVDEASMRPEWLLRHGVRLHGTDEKKVRNPPPEVLKDGVAAMDAWGRLWGLVRHGELLFETFDFGCQTALASHYKVVDLMRYTEQTRKDEREKEYNRIRRMPWWRRLFLPRKRP